MSLRSPLSSLPINVWFCGQESPDRQRGDRYSAAAVRAHSGKMLPHLARQILQAYTKPGDWVLDPMSGIGTTGVEAVYLGRHYVGIELEERFVRYQKEHLERAKGAGATGRFEVLHGDARTLVTPDLWPGIVPDGLVDAVITSPPYARRLSGRIVHPPSPTLRRLIDAGRFHRGVLPPSYGERRENIGNSSGRTYLSNMEQVYRGCYEALKPGGLLVLVVQPGRDKHLLLPLHHETTQLCRQIGFELLDEVIAVFARVGPPDGTIVPTTAHALVWRRLGIARARAAGYPVSLSQVEHVLVFRRPDPARPQAVPGKPNDKSGASAALVAPGLPWTQEEIASASAVGLSPS